MSDPQPIAPLTEEQIAALRKAHREWIRTDGLPTGFCWSCSDMTDAHLPNPQIECEHPCWVLRVLDRLATLEAALVVRAPMRNHGSAIVCGCCDGTLALEQVGPGCCEMTGSHEAGCAVANVVTAEMARAALGYQETSHE